MSEHKTYEVPAAVADSAHINRAQYEEMYKRSIDDPEGFWAEAAEAVPAFAIVPKSKIFPHHDVLHTQTLC